MMKHDPSQLQGDIMQRSRTCMAMHHSCFDGILRKNTHAYYFSMNSGKTKAGDCRPSSSAQRTPWKPVMSSRCSVWASTVLSTMMLVNCSLRKMFLMTKLIDKSLTNAHGDALLRARSCSYQTQELIEEDHELCFRY